MKTLERAFLCAALAAGATTASHAAGYQHLLDPVVTHTNGMRLASTTSLRNRNVYYQCDPGHVGYCDGHLHTPCLNDWRSLGTRECGRFVPPYTPNGPTGTETVHSHDGLEQTSGESLGAISTDPNRLITPATTRGGAAPQAQEQAAEAPSGGIWLDAIKTIGTKIAAPEA